MLFRSTVSSANVGTYTSWASSSLALTGASASNYTLVGGAVSAVITKAPLGLSLNATYNGTTNFSNSSALGDASSGAVTSGGTMSVKGLVGSEKVNGVTVSDANVDVVNNTTNYITNVSGSNGFNMGNYSIAASRNSSTSGSNITNTNNIRQKP